MYKLNDFIYLLLNLIVLSMDNWMLFKESDKSSFMDIDAACRVLFFIFYYYRRAGVK